MNHKGKEFFILMALLISVNYGHCQDLVRHKKPQYFAITSVQAGSSHVLSVDKSRIHFVYDRLYNHVRDRYLQVPVKLINNSADTLKYQSMSCSWWDIYKTDNREVSVFSPDVCYKNSYVTRMVMPYQEVVATITVRFPKKKLKLQSFRIGMTLERNIDFNGPKTISLDKKQQTNPLMKEEIWSDYIIIPAIIGH